MSFIRLVFRSLVFGIALLGYFVAAFIILLFTRFSFVKARPYLVKLVSIISIFSLKLFNVKVKKEFINPIEKENFLIVSNHLSYLDILIISSLYSSCFVTSNEMKETPFLGKICLFGGCLFVERRKISGISGEVAQLTNALKSGLNVVIFPEAKSTNGEAILKFRRPLFQAAVNSEVRIQTVCLNYRSIDGVGLSLENRDKIFWYDTMPFFGHAMTLFSHKAIEVELSLMDIINSKEFPDKNILADMSYEIIQSKYQKIIN
jgi:1-acyl-sn-glycerol-3-phosphate acyltransferase